MGILSICAARVEKRNCAPPLPEIAEDAGALHVREGRPFRADGEGVQRSASPRSSHAADARRGLVKSIDVGLVPTLSHRSAAIRWSPSRPNCAINAHRPATHTNAIGSGVGKCRRACQLSHNITIFACWISCGLAGSGGLGAALALGWPTDRDRTKAARGLHVIV